MWLRLTAGDAAGGSGDAGESSGGEVSAANSVRSALLAASNWTSPMDFSLAYDSLPHDVFPWLRLMLSRQEELTSELTSSALEAPLSRRTEQAAVTALLASVDRSLAAFDHSIEEDQQILDSPRRRLSLAPRTALAVTYRLLCKRVLLRTKQMVEEHWALVSRELADLNSRPRRSKKKGRRRRGAATHDDQVGR